MPYFSWLAVYTEFGLFGWLAIMATTGTMLRTVRRLPRTYDLEKLVVIAAIVFIFLLGFQENNWEVPQAWFSGLLFLKVLHANASDGRDREGNYPIRHTQKGRAIIMRP